MLRDRLGSTLAVADDLRLAPADIDHRDYDAYGRVRDPSQAALPFLAGLGLSPQTTRGFTNQEHLDDVKLIHMNGRVYDYTLGRFLSVDPVVQLRGNSQSLNPYSYIGNNPLSGKDPSGYTAFGPECVADSVCRMITDQERNGVRAPVDSDPMCAPLPQPRAVTAATAQDARHSSIDAAGRTVRRPGRAHRVRLPRGRAPARNVAACGLSNP